MRLSNMRVKLYHENCWTSELTEMFPEGTLVVPFSRKLNEGVTTTYTLVKTSKTQAKQVTHSERYSKFYPRIVGELGNANHNQMFLISFQFKSENSIYRAIKNIEELIPVQVTYEDEFEIWNFLIPSSGPTNYRKDIINNLRQVADVEGYSLEDGYGMLKGSIDSFLGLIFPPSTMFVLQRLMDIGYFDFPRKVSIDAAARQLGISKGFISKVSRRIFDVLRNESPDGT